MSSPDHKRCLACGYILDHLPEPRCPECGRGFDPDNSGTFLIGRLPRAQWILLIAALALAAEVAACWLYYSLDTWPCPGATALQTAGALVGVYTVCRTLYELTRLRHIRKLRWAWIVALMLSLLALLTCAAPIVFYFYMVYSFSKMKGPLITFS